MTAVTASVTERSSRTVTRPLWSASSDDVIAALAVMAVSIAAAIGMCRVFPDWTFLRPMVITIAVVHGVSLLLRALRVPGWAAVPITALAALQGIAMLFYRDTLSLGLPSSDTLDLVGVDLRLVWSQFPTAVAPVPSSGSYLIAATLTIGLMALLADLFAFRVNGRAEAVMPSGVLFVFTAALGTDRLRIQTAALWLAAAVVAIAALRALHLGSDVSWLGRRRGRLSAALPAAFGMAGVAVLGAVVVGPKLPGAYTDPLLDTRQRQSDVTEVLSPLVDIRSRLVNRTNTEMFTVEAAAGQYWRVTGLSKFDGTTWGLPDSDLQSADGVLNVTSSGAPLLQQRFRIGRLGGHFVPAAFVPITVAQNAAWLPSTDTIVIGGDGLETGDTFNIASDIASPSPEALRATTSNSPPDEIFTELPSDFPDEVVRLAEEVTAGATTSYDQAMLLQDWFRTEFEYDIKVQRGHGDDAIIAFLRNKRGYCEQFSATFAAMARSIGLPARVAVGFTAGELRADGRFHVLGRHAHAWPEVWFDGIGWVLFEPTPGRGAPGQEAHTGVDAAQDTGTGTVDGITESDDPASTTIAPGETTPVTTLVPGAGAPPTTIASGPGTATARDGSGDGGGMSPVGWFVIGVLALGAWALLMPKVVKRLTRPGRTPSEQVIDAWHGTIGSLEIAGAPAPDGRTPLEYAVAVERELGVDHRSLGELARYVTRAVYSPAGVGEPAAFRAAVLRTHLDEASQALLPWWSRLWCRIDPRLVRRRLVGAPNRRR